MPTVSELLDNRRLPQQNGGIGAIGSMGRSTPVGTWNNVAGEGVGTFTPTTLPPQTPTVDPTAQRARALALARLGITQELGRRGLDPTSYAPQFESYLNNILGAVPETETNYDAYFSPNLANDVLTGIQAGQRNQFRGQVNSRFGTNFASQYLPDTLLDETITGALNSQYENARSILDRGRARGQYNDRGFNAGMNTLNNARTSQQARLNTIEGDILSGYRSRLGDVRNNAFNSATGYQLGDNFNLEDFASQADSIANQARINAPGEFFSALGNTPMFDLGNIGGAAGQAQGAVNLNNLDVREGLEKRRLASARGRGLGSQGAF